ncbi:MAG: hypothetical protein ACKO7O_08875, partial [Bacteroidota bacterium]
MAKKNSDPLMLIQNENDDIFQEGIALLEEKGNLSQLQELVRIYSEETIPSRRFALHSFLASITKKGIREAWMELLKEIQNPKERQQILQVLWNTRLDFSPYLVEFVKWALDGDYQNTLESLTVIEQMEGPFNEEQLLEAQCLVQEFKNSPNVIEERKQVLLNDLIARLDEFST